MLNIWNRQLDGTSQAAVVIISIAIMLAGGFLLTRVTKRLRLPNVTAYIVCGILIGPYCLNLIPQKVISGTDFLPDIALAFIAFGTGEYFQIETLKKNGKKVIAITLLESCIGGVDLCFDLWVPAFESGVLHRAVITGHCHRAGFDDHDDPADGSERRFCGDAIAGGGAG